MVAKKTESIKIQGKEQLKEAVDKLIEMSVWFSVEPWPEDAFLVSTKAEGWLRKAGLA